MKTIILLLSIFPSLAVSQQFSEPLLSAREATEIANSYLTSEKQVELRNFRLEGVSFNYLDGKSNQNQWLISYWAKPNKNGSVNLGGHFSVLISNDKEPKVEFIPGL